MALQRVDAGNSAGPLHAAQDAAWSARYPLLVEMMVTTQWEDKKPREVSTVLLVAEGGVWKGLLNDRANRRQAWVTGQTIDEVLDALESGLASGNLGWRHAPPGKQDFRR